MVNLMCIKNIIIYQDELKAYNYCKNINPDNKELRDVIYKSNNILLILLYCINVKDDLAMRDLILKSKVPQYCYFYCKHVYNNEPMRDIIYDSGGCILIEKYNKRVLSGYDE